MSDVYKGKKFLIAATLVLFAAAATGSVLKKHQYVFSTPSWQSYSVVAQSPESPDPDMLKDFPRFLYGKYKTSEYDTLSSLALAFGTDAGTLKNSNALKSFRSGMELNVLNRSGLLYKVSANETLDSIAKKFKPADKNLDAFMQEIVRENRIPPSSLILGYAFDDGDQVFLPGVSLSPEKKFIPSKNMNAGSRGNAMPAARIYVYPLKYKRISSYFGYRKHPTKKKSILHKGCDFQAPLGTAVFAARSGTVYEAGWERGYGNTVEIIHSDGYITRYAHLSSINVKKGDPVIQGESKIGEVGKSGTATGYHLHFEIITPKGKVQDPLPKMKSLPKKK
ncbi:MAG: M23 family metallopeptidase [Elusimicrobiales bacterium]|nr:M23 family metallopeptidase [Elusimicrobiales bacterium]